VKPISAADQRTLDCAIAMANELTARSMNDLDNGTPPESPHTPGTPGKRKFSFRFPTAGTSKHTSPRAERKTFSEEAASIPDIQVSKIVKPIISHGSSCMIDPSVWWYTNPFQGLMWD
jgi:hypothetical protein